MTHLVRHLHDDDLRTLVDLMHRHMIDRYLGKTSLLDRDSSLQCTQMRVRLTRPSSAVETTAVKAKLVMKLITAHQSQAPPLGLHHAVHVSRMSGLADAMAGEIGKVS